MAIFANGRHVEVKGFGRWLGTTLLGNVVGYFNQAFYIVNLWTVIDSDHSGEYDNGPRDDEYYFIKKDQFQINHPHFVRNTLPEQSGQEFNIGDVVVWNDICNLRKGVINGKRFRADKYLTDPDEQWTYAIQLEGSNEIVDDYSYRIRPYLPWI